MRLSIDHRTRYRFTQPQTRLVQMLRMTPEDTETQTVAAWRIDVDCDARLRETRDGFGNRVTMLYLAGEIEEIEIAVSGEVLTVENSGVVRGAHEPLPPALFLRPTERTAPSPEIVDFASAAVAGSSDPLDRLHRLNTALFDRVEIDRGRPLPGLAAADAFALPAATSRDLAQIFITGVRLFGTPARYVSGYCLACEEGSTHPTPHGWAEAFVDGLGWIGFDPASNLCPNDSYVRVAVGLDSAQAAPVAGSRLGPGEERLDVDVQVERLAGE